MINPLRALFETLVNRKSNSIESPMGENFPNLKQFNFWQLFNPLEMTLSIIHVKKKESETKLKIEKSIAAARRLSHKSSELKSLQKVLVALPRSWAGNARPS